MNTSRYEKNARRLSRLAAAMLTVAAFAAHAAAQVSTDPDSPTPMTTNVVAGKGNGKARTHYYSFVATAADPGEVKVKVTASTDERSTNLRVNFLGDEGKEVMDEIYLIPHRDPATKVGKHTFAERQKVVMRVTLPDDPQVKLLNYKIEVTGAVEFEQPAATPDPASAHPADAPAAPDPAAPTSDAAGQSEQPAQQAAEVQPGKSVKHKVRDGAKRAGKSALKDLLKDDNLF
ncbi:MAG TPA: hypothetical protein VGX48_08500 [Pyrinomonadaceae bacterium]|nr:hypothetical protein [Pyrinomonadaceae bacterium]